MKKIIAGIALATGGLLYATGTTTNLTLSAKDAHSIAKKIWHNECNNSVQKLTWWNEGEHFASLGIGHFIWYPTNEPITFTQTFPELLTFLRDHGTQLPAWLNNTQQPCPWHSREEFFAASRSKLMNELRALLANTIDLQTMFIFNRLEKALPTMLKSVAENKRAHIQQQFERIACSPMGMYALTDYLNFKGEGTNPKERYHGQGWGLLNVLEHMQGSTADAHAIQEFANIATTLLTQRVANAPAEKNEQQRLKGWKKRVSTYSKAAAQAIATK